MRLAGRGTLPLEGVGRAVVLTPLERRLEPVALETRVRVSGTIAAIRVIADEPIDESALLGPALAQSSTESTAHGSL